MSNNLSPTEIVRLYRVWTSILYRCRNPKNKQYKNYGGRGIKIYREWEDFDKFCYDVGKRPNDTYHLDRIDNNKGYSKENCRWTSPKVNHRNKRNNRYYETHIGKICQSEFIEIIGYTKKQFQRAMEKYGEEKFIDLFRENKLPKKRIVSDLQDVVGKKFGLITIIELHPDKSCGAKYTCRCDCGKIVRKARFKILHGISLNCTSCAKKGDKNPNSIKRKAR